jgi:hypothetical protein
MPNGNRHIMKFFNTKLSGDIAGFMGRFAGGALVTNNVLFGRGGKALKGKAKKLSYIAGTASISYIYTFFGLSMLGIAKGLRRLEDIVQFSLTGKKCEDTHSSLTL